MFPIKSNDKKTDEVAPIKEEKSEQKPVENNQLVILVPTSEPQQDARTLKQVKIILSRI